MFRPSNTKGYNQNSGGRNAYCGMRGYKRKLETTELDTKPEAKTDPVNEIPEEKPGEKCTLETELEPTKEMEK
tara:strand:+ start:213 stop:431 length:219 start_codon:yes stop_codon:yes gene_type:complete